MLCFQADAEEEFRERLPRYGSQWTALAVELQHWMYAQAPLSAIERWVPLVWPIQEAEAALEAYRAAEPQQAELPLTAEVVLPSAMWLACWRASIALKEMQLGNREQHEIEDCIGLVDWLALEGVKELKRVEEKDGRQGPRWRRLAEELERGDRPGL